MPADVGAVKCPFVSGTLGSCDLPLILVIFATFYLFVVK